MIRLETLGNTCRSAMANGRRPAHRAARTYSVFITPMAPLRTTRANDGTRDADGDHRGDYPLTVDRGEHDRQQQGGEREQQVVGAHEHFAPPLGHHRREDAQAAPRDGGDPDRDDPDEHRGARADHEQRHDVAAELVGAQPVPQPTRSASRSLALISPTS
jgi:hypothetical protein